MKVVIFEAEGGTDKGDDGHRKDTMPIVNSLIKRGVHAEVIFYKEDSKEKIFNQVKGFDCYIPRVNPGNLPDEKSFFEFLLRLSKVGLIGMTPPDVMVNLGSKNSLSKLVGTGLVPDDTYTYYKIDEFTRNFPKSLSYGERVLKQNRGSTGSGIWRVSVNGDEKVEPGKELPLSTEIKCTEAKDNHVEIHTLGDFMKKCNMYIEGENGMLVDMRFLPRIKEGEIRFLMVGTKPINVIKKVPADSKDAFSATLYSGAKYTYHKPEEFSTLIAWFNPRLNSIREKLISNGDLPLIWSADFILDWNDKREDVYYLGEINCSCVGFTSNLGQGIEDTVAEEIISRLKNRKK